MAPPASLPPRKSLTVAALALLGAGVAAAAYARRRAGVKDEPAKRPRSKLQRETLAQLDLAIALLEGRGEEPPEQTIHETRKALKRARALVRLQRSALGRKRFQRENRALRDVGRRLAVARDAEVVVDALDLLLARHPRRLGHSPAVAELRARLLTERERARADTCPGAPARATALEDLRATRRRVERWKLSAGERATVRSGLERIYREGRARGRRAREAGTSEALHEWRKRAKDLRYATEALRLRAVARQADRLGETIGEEHDLTLLAERLRIHRKCFKGERSTRKTLRRLIEKRRRRLRRRAVDLGEKLYRRKPRRFVRQVQKP